MTATTEASQSEFEQLQRERARSRRLERMRSGGLSTARKACLACPIMALFWVLGLWAEIPYWAIVLITLGSLAAIGLLTRFAVRGRTLRL